MPRVSAEQLVLDAVRCSLSAGDYTTAENYLNSRVKDSSDASISAYVKLYGVWSMLSKIEAPADLNAPLALLRSYSTQPAMEAVRSQVLLTIWYIEGDGAVAARLSSEYPNSPEAAIVSGNVSLLPAPFWFFLPAKNKIGDSGVRIADAPKPATSAAAAGTAAPRSVVYWQLGLFRMEENAKKMAADLQTKGFSPLITQETRASGSVYYVVRVSENPGATIGTQLKNAGFSDAYPIRN
jgi:hypothetical protein